MYHRGTLEEFEAWHEPVKKSMNLPSKNGKTTAYSSAIAHPENENDYIWLHNSNNDPDKQSYSLEEVKNFGFLPPDPTFNI